MFNPENFVNQETDSELSTRMEPIPEGEYNSYIESVEAATVGQDEYPVLRIRHRIDDMDGSIEAATGRQNPSIEQMIFLDLTEQGGLDNSKGKNVQLGRLRDALGQNKAGQPWSPKMMEGQPLVIRVGHQPDKNDPETIRERVQRVRSQG